MLVKQTQINILYPDGTETISVHWINESEETLLSRLFNNSAVNLEVDAVSATIEQLAAQTNALGSQPLWEGYPPQDRGPTRLANEVRTRRSTGNIFAGLVRASRPRVIVEFGTAFGVSGMYWLAGLEANQQGELFTFEPNKVWAELARANLSQISSRFNLEVGTFEENVDKYLDDRKTIDIAFIDAIHTREFVMPQLQLVVERSSPGALIVLDDINFSEDMKNCWYEVSQDARFSASVALDNRVGIVELGG